MTRPATPTKLKIIRGNPGKRALPQNEPQPVELNADTPAPDKFATNPEAVKAWADVLPRLCQMRVATNADVPMLVIYCEAYAEEVNAVEQMDESGSVQVAGSGHMQISAWYTVRDKALARRMKILSLFGMTPADRTKVQTVAAPKKANPFD